MRNTGSWKKLGKKQKWIHKSETPLIQPVQNKQHPTSVMFLGCIGQPNDWFDGKVALLPVTEKYVAKKRSKYHEKGEEYDKCITMTKEVFLKMMKDSVIPPAVEIMEMNYQGNFSDCEISFQIDNAGGHGGGRGNVDATTLEDLRAFCSSNYPQYRIIFKAQASKSPDFNLLDLGVWWSLDTCVQKKKQNILIPKEKDIIDTVGAGWAEWNGARISKICTTLDHLLQKAIELNGSYTAVEHSKKTSWKCPFCGKGRGNNSKHVEYYACAGCNAVFCHERCDPDRIKFSEWFQEHSATCKAIQNQRT